jgi:arylsulfatase A-like enzyme
MKRLHGKMQRNCYCPDKINLFMKYNKDAFFKFIGLTGICVTGEFISQANTPVALENKAPNILIITVDNLGYGDLLAYNKNSLIKTPNIDRLAKQSARLTSFYTASPTSTASRAALLTGRFPQRNKLDYQLAGIEGNWGVGLRHSEVIIPQIIKKSPVNYATGAFGKWNIGFAQGSRPTERGFDEFLGNCSGNIDYYHHLYDGKHDMYKSTEEVDRDGEYTTDLYANTAIDFIKRKTKATVPWFVYLPFNAPHYPKKSNLSPGQPLVWQAPDWALKVYGLSPGDTDPQKRYNAVITALDAAIGRVLSSLDSLGITDNTFVFLYSDNGAFMIKGSGLEVASNAPLRDGGVTCWEGGVRVVAFARWPGKIKANTVIETPLWSPDLMVACAKISGAVIPEDLILDGKDPLPVLTGKVKKSPHKTFFFQYETHAALRWGDYKIVRTKPDQPWQLFNLKEDISEMRNLASKRGDIIEKLSNEFNSKLEEIKFYP